MKLILKISISKQIGNVSYPCAKGIRVVYEIFNLILNSKIFRFLIFQNCEKFLYSS